MANSASKKSLKFLAAALLLIIIVAGTATGTIIYLSKSGMLAGNTAQPAVASEPANSPAPSPIFLALDPFTVTLHDANTDRILYIEITVRLLDGESRRLLIEYMPEVRNRVLSELSRQGPVEIQTPQGRTQLAVNLAKALKDPFHPQPKGPQVSTVLFTAFVIQ